MVTSAYEADGRLATLSSDRVGTLVSDATSNALGQVTRYLLGTSEVTQAYAGLDGATLDGAPLGVLKEHRWRSGATDLVRRLLGYDAAGNVASVDDTEAGEGTSFAYDHLDWLLSASGAVTESYAYSAIGNLTSKGGQPLTYADPAHTHAATSFGSTAYVYDANGSMTSRGTPQGTQTITYDPERRPTRVSIGAAIARFAYDGDGVRRKRGDATGCVHYIGAYERNVGNGVSAGETITTSYAALGRAVAIRVNGQLRWIGVDHLGSTILVADATFTALDRMRYLPFGGTRDAGTSLGTDHLFTGQVDDASIGLMWYASRAYDPLLGRFTCPDTIVPSPGDPQSLNRYSYVRNNPLKYTDPSGHEEMEADYRERREREDRKEAETNFQASREAAERRGENTDNWTLLTGDTGSTIRYSAPAPDDGNSVPFPDQSYVRIVAVGPGPDVAIVYRGREVKIYTSGKHPDSGKVREFNPTGGCTTFSMTAIVCTDDYIFTQPGSRLLAHELGHVEQAREIGRNDLYIAQYVIQLVQTANAMGIRDPRRYGEAHDQHPMEIDAESRVDRVINWLHPAP